MSDKHKIRIPFFFRVTADQHFLLRLQIVRASDFASVLFSDDLLDLIKSHRRDLIRLRKLNSENLQLLRILLFQKIHRVLKISGLHRHDILESVDIAHLEIKACIFVQMALRVVLLRPEHRRCLKHAVKHADHHLFIKLRALLKNRRSVEIFETEEVRTALRALGTDLRCVYLCKSFSVQKIPESSYQPFLNPESRTLPDIPKGDGTVVQLRFQRCVHLPLCNRQRHGRCRLAQDPDASQSDLYAVGRFLGLSNDSFRFHGRRLFHIFDVESGYAFLIDTLHKAFPLPENDKRHVSHIADRVDCTVHLHGLSLHSLVKKFCKFQSFCFLYSFYQFHFSFSFQMPYPGEIENPGIL